jgi:hypothetical protein
MQKGKKKRKKRIRGPRKDPSPCKVEKREALVKTRSAQLEMLELAPNKKKQRVFKKKRKSWRKRREGQQKGMTAWVALLLLSDLV